MNIPYGRVASTLGTASKYVRPALGHMGAGAAIGAAAAYGTGNNPLTGALVGGTMGLGYKRGVHSDLMSGGRAGMVGGNFNVRNAFSAAASRQKGIWSSL